MKLIEQINSDFMSAYKAKNMTKKDFLGVLKTEVTKESKTPDNAFVVAKIKSMIKSAAATNSLTEEELGFLNPYLPQQLSEDDLKEVISRAITVVDASSMKDMGKVMSRLKETHSGQYDGGLASKLIKEALNAK